mgnify:FL=1
MPPQWCAPLGNKLECVILVTGGGMRGVKGHVRSGARWVHPPNRSPIRQNSPIFGCFCSMGLHFGGMDAAPLWVCFVVGAWDSDMRRLRERRCMEWASRGVHFA